jgi:hypothetical protein
LRHPAEGARGESTLRWIGRLRCHGFLPCKCTRKTAKKLRLEQLGVELLLRDGFPPASAAAAHAADRHASHKQCSARILQTIKRRPPPPLFLNEKERTAHATPAAFHPSFAGRRPGATSPPPCPLPRSYPQDQPSAHRHVNKKPSQSVDARIRCLQALFCFAKPARTDRVNETNSLRTAAQGLRLLTELGTGAAVHASA